MSDQPSSHTPFFSVIIPTYNREKSIVEAVESVLSQTFKDFELLVIDDGSTDGTADLLKPISERDSRLRYIYQQNAERSAARNNGIDQSKGQYLCFLDSDDIYLPEHLEKFHKTITEHGCPVAYFLSNAIMEFNGKRKKEPPYVTQTDDPVELMLKISVASQQVAIHNSILREHKYDVNLRIGEDQELWSRVVKHYPVIRSDQYTIVIRDLGDRTVNAMDPKMYRSNLTVRKRIISQDKEGRIKPEWRKFALSAAYYKLAVSYLKSNKRLAFFWNILQSMMVDPGHFPKDKILVMISAIPFLKPMVYDRLPAFAKDS
jgi:glycosyltransferase involved in cell wall biosynthesis